MDIEQEARTMGWIEQDKFKGDPSAWVSAEEFVERGRKVMPILRHNNERLMTELEQRKLAETALRTEISSLRETISDLTKFQAEEVKRQVAAEKSRLLVDLKAAKAAGDTDLEIDLQEELADVKAREKEIGKAKPEKEASTPPQQAETPEFREWAAVNPWFGKDNRKTALAIGIAQELRQTTTLEGKAFFDKVSEEMDQYLSPRPAHSKVEGSATPSGSSSPKGKTFSDLPPDAKQVCEAQAKKFVGQGRAFKDEAAWKAHYVKIYFGDEA